MNTLVEAYTRSESHSESRRVTRILKRLGSALVSPRKPAESAQWEPFGKKPINGIFWVTGERSMNGPTRDENGILTFTLAGDTCQYTALVSIQYCPETGIADAFPIAPHETGDFNLNYGITHYAPFVTPELPETDHLNA